MCTLAWKIVAPLLVDVARERKGVPDIKAIRFLAQSEMLAFRLKIASNGGLLFGG
jgi:hypothetical protein